MQIDIYDQEHPEHRWWAKWTLRLLALAALTCGAYGIYAHSRQIPLSGGSVPGLIFGFAGYFLMLYAAAFSLRKKLPKIMYGAISRLRRTFPNWKTLPKYSTWHLAAAQKWMRGHLWLGLLSYPLILFHAGLSFGTGFLTRSLMWIFTIVVLTGVLGAILQHFMPRMMKHSITHETIYEEIDHEREYLENRAASQMANLRESNDLYAVQSQLSDRPSSHGISTRLVRIDKEAGEGLRYAYTTAIQPYLARRGTYHHPLNNPQQARTLFEGLHADMPELVQPAITELEDICARKRDLDRQSRLHRVLHGWLIAHVPLSFLLILLGLVHAVKAISNG